MPKPISVSWTSPPAQTPPRASGKASTISQTVAAVRRARCSMRSAQSSIYHVEVLPRGRRDLRHIYAYIQAENSHQAHAWSNGLEAAIAGLDRHPARGSL